MKYLLSVVFIALMTCFIVLAAWDGAGQLMIHNGRLRLTVSDYFERFDGIGNLDLRVLRNILSPAENFRYVYVQDAAAPEVPQNEIDAAVKDVEDACIAEDPIQEIQEEIIISVFNHRTGGIYYMNLEEYLVGVVFSEMPASFELDALKAQAVAARSYAVYKMLHSREEERELHRGAYVCTDFRHCKAHISLEALSERYGEIGHLWQRVRNAVFATAGEIIIYNGQPAIAVFHAMSGDMTESAENVWGYAMPHLTAVPTKEADNRSVLRNFETEAIFTAEEFSAVLTEGGGQPLGNPEGWIERIAANSSERVDYAVIYGEPVSGVRLRELFGLRSTDFTIELDEYNFIFRVRGHGHGVGMSQYGANLMALTGSDYTEILKWYYTGVNIGFADMFFSR